MQSTASQRSQGVTHASHTCAGGTLLTCIAPFVNIQFLGSSLTFMMVCAPFPFPASPLGFPRSCLASSVHCPAYGVWLAASQSARRV